MRVPHIDFHPVCPRRGLGARSTNASLRHSYFAMHQQSQRQLQDRVTALTIPDVLDAAVHFFSRRGGVYSAYLEKQGPSHVVMRGQGGEEIVVAARTVPGGSAVSGSSYLFDQQIAQFLASLPPAAPIPPEAPALPADDASASTGAPA